MEVNFFRNINSRNCNSNRILGGNMIIGMKQLKLLAYGIISLLVAYWVTATASDYWTWIETGEGMTLSIIAVFSGVFLGLLYLLKS